MFETLTDVDWNKVIILGDFNMSIPRGLSVDGNVVLNHGSDKIGLTCCYPKYHRGGDYILTNGRLIDGPRIISPTPELASDHEFVSGVYRFD
jgi:hypothetical protein